MQTEVQLFFAQLVQIFNAIPFISIIGTTFVISFFVAVMKLWKGGD